MRFGASYGNTSRSSQGCGKNKEGKELDPPVPPRYRNRVNSLYLPASSFPALGGSNIFTPWVGE